ncbi:MAG: DASS family sodium-coupled anion symporter [Campylobacterales bacterium]|nr:DASS family sodium-coupled anion symporter [Campylobacterales bacterium]
MRPLVWGLVVAVAMGSGMLLWLSPLQAALVGAVTLLVLLWSNEALPLGVVSLLPILLFPALGILEVKATTAHYGNPILFLFLGGFMLAIAVEKSGLHRWIAARILSLFPSTARGMILSLMLSAALLSSLLSNTATALLLMSIALFLSEERRIKMRFALAIAYGSSIGGIMTPIGTPPNLILYGFMQGKAMEMIPFVQWMWMVAPLAFAMLLMGAWLLGIGVKGVQIDHPAHPQGLSNDQLRMLWVLGALIVLLLLNAPIRPYWEGLGMNESLLLLGVGLSLFFPPLRQLEWQSDARKVPYEIMFLFGAGFSIAHAFAQTGLASTFADSLLGFTALEPLLLLLLVAVLITFATELTSNTALISIMLPVIYALSMQSETLDTTLVMMVATVCSSYAFMLPIATAPNAIAMSSGAVETKEMMRYGLVLNLVGIVLIVSVAWLFWRIALAP